MNKINNENLDLLYEYIIFIKNSEYNLMKKIIQLIIITIP